MQSKPFVLICGEGDPLASATLPLVAALIALDVEPLRGHEFFESLEPEQDEGGSPVERHRHVWGFNGLSKCGRYDAEKCRRAWGNKDWLVAPENQAHPLRFIYLAFITEGIVEPPAGFNQAPLSRATYAPFLSAEWRRRWPDGMFRPVGDALAVLPLLRAELEKSVPALVVRRGRKRALIPGDATPEEEQILLEKIT